MSLVKSLLGVKKNYLTLNFEKTQFIQFVTNHHKHLDIQVKFKGIVISKTTNVKFLGLLLDNMLNWKKYSSELTSKLNKACYAIRAVKSLLSNKVQILVNCAYFHSCVMLWFDILGKFINSEKNI